MELNQLKGALEAVLFAHGEPVSAARLADVFEMDEAELLRVLAAMRDEYEAAGRGICLLRLEDSWQMCSAPEHASAIRKTLESRKPARLSQTALEVLAIVAYFQPVTRTYIEQIRGVDSAYTVGLLLERDLIQEAGRLAVPGRPIQYRTTETFLRSFGLTSLEELPELPSATQEGAQMTMELEQAIEKLRAQDEAQAKAETAVEVSGEVPEGEAGA